MNKDQPLNNQSQSLKIHRSENQRKKFAIREIVDKLDDTFTPEQMRVASYLALPMEHRPTQRVIAEEIGVTESAISKWRHSPKMQKLIKELIKVYFIADIPEVIEAMRQKAVKGDEKCAKLYLQFLEQLDVEHKGTVVNVNLSRIDVENKIKILQEKL